MLEVWLIRHAQSQNNAFGETHRQPDPSLTELGHWQAQSLAKYLSDQMEPPADLYVSGFLRALQTAEPLSQWAQDRRGSSAVTAAAEAPGPEDAGSPGLAKIWLDLHEVGGCYVGHGDGPLAPHPGLEWHEVRRTFPWAIPPSDWTSGGWNRLPHHETRALAVPRADRVVASLRQAAASLQQAGGGVSLESTAPGHAIPATASRTTIPGFPTPSAGGFSHPWVLVSHGEFIALLLSRLLTGSDEYLVRPRSLYNTSITKLLIGPDSCRLVEFNQIHHLSPREVSG